MARKKGDVRIGYRAYEEVLRLFPKMKDAIAKLGCEHYTVYQWGVGICPSAVNLARLHKAGADVIYILVGTRSKPI